MRNEGKDEEDKEEEEEERKRIGCPGVVMSPFPSLSSASFLCVEGAGANWL